MPPQKLTPRQLDEVRSLAAQWGKIVRRAFGDTVQLLKKVLQ
jgi:hypothetical protein